MVAFNVTGKSPREKKNLTVPKNVIYFLNLINILIYTISLNTFRKSMIQDYNHGLFVQCIPQGKTCANCFACGILEQSTAHLFGNLCAYTYIPGISNLLSLIRCDKEKQLSFAQTVWLAFSIFTGWQNSYLNSVVALRRLNRRDQARQKRSGNLVNCTISPKC